MRTGKFLESVRWTVEHYGMDVRRPLAMVSGGPDSVALLRVLLELGAEPAVLHVDHGVRGDESLEDAEFVRRLCEELDVACEVRRLDLGDASNFQDTARRERYRVAEEVADARGLGTIVTGHTADDVAETVLMNLARGAGLRGLAGIPPVRGRFGRPLIRAARTEILEYLESLGQPPGQPPGQSYRTDPTNLTRKYARNRVRLEVLPALEELYPGAGANVARTAGLVREDLEALEGISSRAVRWDGREATLSPSDLRDLPHALRRHAVRLAYRAVRPGGRGLELSVVESVLRLMGPGPGEGTRTLDLPEGVVAAARAAGGLAFYRPGSLETGSVAVEKDRFTFGGWEVEVREIEVSGDFDTRDAKREAAKREDVAYLDAGSGPYRVRLAREGDIIRPLGLGGTKKVLRAMMDRGVPSDVRRRTPVIVDRFGEIAWIFRGEIGDRHKVGGSAEKIIRLEVREIHGNV
ncbi:MAG: tRNA lysidine(34) synthetase TilS [Rubrobacteraceae bacterium]